MKQDNIVLNHATDPKKLEALYRQDPAFFIKDFEKALPQWEDSPIKAVWMERLYYEFENGMKPNEEKKQNFPFHLLTVLGLALASGIAGRLLFPLIVDQKIAPVNILLGIFLFLAFYFLLEYKPKKRTSIAVLLLLFLSGVYLNILPLENRDSIVLAYLHFPVWLWMLLGAAYTGDRFMGQDARISYIKFQVEFALLYGAMAIGGILVTGITLQLFSMIGMEISEFYAENVVLFGATGLTVVAAGLAARDRGFSGNASSYIAKIFSPVILLTLTAFVFFVVASGKNPFLDRDFLLIYNGVLLFVLAMTMFFIIETGSTEKTFLYPMIHTILISVTLLLDSFGLSAILFRLASFGVTANRLAVLGLNLIVWIHLAWILVASIQFLRKKNQKTHLEAAVVRFLPVYGFWAALVVFAFPIIFTY